MPSRAEETHTRGLIETPSHETLEAVCNNGSILSLITEYLEFKEEVREGALGKIAKFCMSHTNNFWLILDVVRAVKHSEYALYC